MNRYHAMNTAPHKIPGGFSLVEMAIVLMIVGLLLGGLIPTLSAQIETQHISETRRQMNEIKEALVGFAIINGRLPCPADGPTAPGGADYGKELVTGSGVSASCTLATTRGVLPWVTLGTTEADAWGRRFTYRVTATYADGHDGTDETTCTTATGVSFQLCSSANLNVKATSGGSNVATDVPAVVVSHGKNGLGAYPAGGGAQIGTATGDENENANDTTDFVSKDQAQDGFDDLVVWLSPNTLANRMVTVGKLP